MSRQCERTYLVVNSTPNRDGAADDVAAAFSATYRAHSSRVHAYARRRCEASDAHDVVAETFLVAWRRWDDVPPDPLPWLLVVARNTIANQRRSATRRGRLADCVAHIERLAGTGGSAEHEVVERAAMLAALRQLTDLEREAVLLVAWDGLSNADAAVVADCSTRAFEVRLSRARARLTRAAATADPSPRPAGGPSAAHLDPVTQRGSLT